MIVTMEQLKEQINQTLDDDDVLIASKIAAAQSHIERLLGFSIETSYGGSDQDPIPAPLAEAVLQLAAWWYEQREAGLIGSGSGIIPFGVVEIVNEYRAFSFGTDDA